LVEGSGGIQIPPKKQNPAGDLAASPTGSNSCRKCGRKRPGMQEAKVAIRVFFGIHYSRVSKIVRSFGTANAKAKGKT
jgi:hypothetical protein